MKTLIVGYGNPVRGDDSVGWVVAEHLRKILPTQDCEIETHQQLTLEHAARIGVFERVIWIDAVKRLAPGQIEIARLAPAEDLFTGFSHQLKPETVLAGARDLFGASPQAFLVSIGGASFDFGAELTPRVQAAVPAIVAQIAELVT